MSHIRSLLPALFTLVFAAGYAPEAAAQSLSADEKELASYRLTMPNVRKVVAVTRAIGEEAAQDPRVKEHGTLTARIDALEEKEELTVAETAELEKLHERIEALESRMEEVGELLGDGKTLDEMEAGLKKYPGAMRALAREGLTPREYSLCMMALLQAALIEGFSQGKVDLGALPAGVNPENVRFIRENKAELDALQKEMAGRVKK